MKRTKIISTIGPACNNEKTIKAMLNAGMNVARFNMSHDTHVEHHERIELVKKLRKELDMPVALLIDTKGREIRLKKFENNSVYLNINDKFILTSREILGNQVESSITYKNLPNEVTKGCKILIDDGKIELLVEDKDSENIYCRVIAGGKISNNKGINVPSVHLNMPYLSEIDKRDLLFAIEEDVEYVAASFVRSAEDVRAIRTFLNENGGKTIRIIAKIENQEGIDNFDEILEGVCGIMVARGDMGVEVDYEKLPGIQKRFIASTCLDGKIAITATQMLESMINNPTPTRAEISDIANAVFDGTSAIMLSGETANGKYPIEAVKTMTKIAKRAEKDAFDLGYYEKISTKIVHGDATLAISHATCTTAKDLKAKAIITVTQSGVTARRISRFRPEQVLVASTPVAKTYNQLSLSWGVNPVMSEEKKSSDELLSHAMECAKNNGLVKSGDVVVLTGGMPIGQSGNTNLLKVDKIH